MVSRWWPRLTVVWPKSTLLACSLGLTTPVENLGRHTRCTYWTSPYHISRAMLLSSLSNEGKFPSFAYKIEPHSPRACAHRRHQPGRPPLAIEGCRPSSNFQCETRYLTSPAPPHVPTGDFWAVGWHALAAILLHHAGSPAMSVPHLWPPIEP
jgi:hypothetical protein